MDFSFRNNQGTGKKNFPTYNGKRAMLNWLHGRCIFGRRVRKLAAHLAEIIPPGARVLDVGCGDGAVARALLDLRPDLDVAGLDVLARPQSHIPVSLFDGQSLPFENDAFDVVLFVDVLHHTDDPMVLLREADRVAKRAVVIKDHTTTGLGASWTLRFMDHVGNARHGVALPYNYWSHARWQQAFHDLGWNVAQWKRKLGLYAWPINWLFGRSLHFIACLEPMKNQPFRENFASSLDSSSMGMPVISAMSSSMEAWK